MGPSVSKSVTLNQILNETIITTMMENTSNVASSISQTNSIALSSVEGAVIDINQENAAKVNISVMTDQTSVDKLSADLKTKLAEAVKNNQNTIGYSISDVETTNIVQNVVNANVTVKNMTTLSSNITQKNEIAIGSVKSDALFAIVNQENTADAIMKFSSKMSSEIESSVIGDANLKKSYDNKQSNPVTAGIDSLADMVKAFSPAYMFMFVFIIIIFVCGLGIGVFYLIFGRHSNHHRDGGCIDYYSD